MFPGMHSSMKQLGESQAALHLFLSLKKGYKVFSRNVSKANYHIINSISKYLDGICMAFYLLLVMNKVPNILLMFHYETQVSFVPSKASKNYSSSTFFGAIECYCENYCVRIN